MTIKSQDELPQSGRDNSTLLATIDELERVKKLYERAKYWLNEIVNSHRCTPISTAEKAIKDLEELEK